MLQFHGRERASAWRSSSSSSSSSCKAAEINRNSSCKQTERNSLSPEGSQQHATPLLALASPSGYDDDGDDDNDNNKNNNEVEEVGAWAADSGR